MDAKETRWLRRALTLARKAEGRTRPNPPVGAVVVKRGRVIGEGFHARAGQPHAEVEALDACRASPRGATLYVTLEPCSTTGRTPPCTERIIRDGITRVVVGCPDPNPRHAGAGLAALAAAGIAVSECNGVCRAQAEELIAPFAKHVTTGLPFVTLKLALTLDGRTADRTGTSKWITGEKARAEVQRMRRRADAVMVGAGTVCADNPSLLCRLPGCDTQMRVIVDASGRTPPDAQVYTDRAATRTVIATTRAAAARNGKAWAQNGAQVWTFTPDRAGRIPLRQLMKRLGGEGLLHVLCEGGAQLADALHNAGLVDDYSFFYAPAILGDNLLPGLPRLRLRDTRRIGDDLLVRIRNCRERGASRERRASALQSAMKNEGHEREFFF
ncbi:MAG: bifunctional diaminohydroxyphosphoribosylaminopyrimidine deaminase/5-amino-6-(5-phosphoribosylamino)uracil reductase RibD [Kiritimatiellaeota bacterium]|nr:bifunctional diaminohydroxyphosphoribosylaminopyrimidine deaminase/5-amino-6-(5-phosphoribosylamino)uracil reductase RibD [Kiritimatiellota bacterium]